MPIQYDNKPNLDNNHFEQTSGNTLNLSGKTQVMGTNGQFIIRKNAGVGKVMISDSGGTMTWTTPIFSNVAKQLTKASHGFGVNTVIGWSGGTYNKAIADGTYDGEVLGIVNKVIGTNDFVLKQAGYVTGLTGLTTSTTYFLSDINAGKIISNAPTIVGHIIKSVVLATSSSTGWMLPYAGYNVVSGGSGGGILSTTSYSKLSLPTAIGNGGGMIYVTDDVGGATIAFSDGTNWRRIRDNVIIS